MRGVHHIILDVLYFRNNMFIENRREGSKKTVYSCLVLRLEGPSSFHPYPMPSRYLSVSLISVAPPFCIQSPRDHKKAVQKGLNRVWSRPFVWEMRRGVTKIKGLVVKSSHRSPEDPQGVWQIPLELRQGKGWGLDTLWSKKRIRSWFCCVVFSDCCLRLHS